MIIGQRRLIAKWCIWIMNLDRVLIDLLWWWMMRHQILFNYHFRSNSIHFMSPKLFNSFHLISLWIRIWVKVYVVRNFCIGLCLSVELGRRLPTMKVLFGPLLTSTRCKTDKPKSGSVRVLKYLGSRCLIIPWVINSLAYDHVFLIL